MSDVAITSGARVTSAKSHKAEMEAKRRTMESKRLTLGMRSTKTSIMFAKMEDEKDNYFENMRERHPKDASFVDPKYEPEMLPVTMVPPHCTEFHDDNDPVLEPNFKRHKVPLEVRCLEMYLRAKHESASQFKREIQLLIDNQPNADSAWQFVRTMAYTTLWPPLHTRKELKTFETYFCKLNKEEKRRYDRIMSTNII
ncbi:hypothetical protein KR018_008654 [Drosophila ironensis]|nr:hypothetical protein KR018_008654 [Drosophila ironensis]